MLTLTINNEKNATQNKLQIWLSLQGRHERLSWMKKGHTQANGWINPHSVSKTASQWHQYNVDHWIMSTIKTNIFIQTATIWRSILWDTSSSWGKPTSCYLQRSLYISTLHSSNNASCQVNFKNFVSSICQRTTPGKTCTHQYLLMY